MKKRAIIAVLLTLGILLLATPIVLAAVQTVGKDVIGGAGLSTFWFVYFRDHGGIYFLLSLLGAAGMISSVFVGINKNKERTNEAK